MKIALCFLISDPSGSLYKEDLWREWLDYNKDIITIYVHYKRLSDIKSEWLLQYVLPKEHIVNTSYFHVVPAYMSLLNYAIKEDSRNQWFCFLTESCVPIIHPLRFREMFLSHWNTSFLKWDRFPKTILPNTRANLHLFSDSAQLKHNPWFTLKREDALRCLHYQRINRGIYKTICSGKVANESIFAIMLMAFNKLDKVKNENMSIADWSRMMSATSPYLFVEGSKKDLSVIDSLLKENKYATFLRKVSPDFPNFILRRYIYFSEDAEEMRKIREKIWFLECYHFLRVYWISHLFFCIGSTIVIWLFTL
jgi:hypothetical protein